MPDPIVIREQRRQNLSGDRARCQYIFGGFTSVDLVLARIQQFATPTPGSLETEVPYNYGVLTIQMPPDIDELGGGWWIVTATYSPRRPEAIAPGGTAAQAPGHGDSSSNTPVGPEISWGVTGGSQTITQSIKTRQMKLRGGITGTNAQTAPRNWRRAIGVDPRTGDIKGCEKLTGAVKQSIEVEIPGSAITPAWIQLVEELSSPSPTVNLHKFLGYDSGQVLFLGLTSMRSISVGQRWKGTFEVAIARNRKQVVISDTPGQTIILDNVHGWSHIWATYTEVRRTIGGVEYRTTEPHEVYEEQIYEYRDHRLMGLEKRRVKVLT